jgi:hypothetical protein
MAAQRPVAKEGGRREEENRSGIAAGVTGRLCNAKTLVLGDHRVVLSSPHVWFDAMRADEFRDAPRFAAPHAANL